MTTNETKKAVGATNSNGLHTDTNIGDFHTIEAANQALIVDVSSMGNLAAHSTNTPASDLTNQDATDELIQQATPPTFRPMHYLLLTGDDLFNLPALQWRIKGVLPAHGLAVLFGPSGSGKSFLVLDMLQSLALGRDWFGHKIKQCTVTYVALEGEAGVANRVKAYQARHGSTSINIRYVTQPFHLLKDGDINALAEAINAEGTGNVVVLDTLSRAIPGSDENDSKTMGLIVSAAKLLQELIGGLVLLIHHTGKDSSKGMRGHSSLYAALDCAIEVKRHGNQREWIVSKSKDGEDGASHPFKLEAVTLGIDDDGDPITSCVVVENPSEQATEKKKPVLGKNQTIALNALKLSLSNDIDPGNDGSPQEEPSLTYQQAIEIVAPLMPGEAKHKKQRAKEALNGLEKNNVLAVNGDRLCIT